MKYRVSTEKSEIRLDVDNDIEGIWKEFNDLSAGRRKGSMWKDRGPSKQRVCGVVVE